MPKVSENFTRDEFACKCASVYGKRVEDGYCGGRQASADITLTNILEKTRAFARRLMGEECYIQITSGNRCQKHNADTDGAEDDSYHLYGLAVDFIVVVKRTHKIVNPKYIYEWLDLQHPGELGLGLYSNRVHANIGPYRRWTE